MNAINKDSKEPLTLKGMVITNFDNSKEPGRLKIYFRTPTGKTWNAYAHPALRVKPLMGRPIDLQINTEASYWRIVEPEATPEEKAEYEARMQESEKVPEFIRPAKETEAQKAYANSF